MLPTPKSFWFSLFLWLIALSTHLLQIGSQYAFAFPRQKVQRSLILADWVGTPLFWDVLAFATITLALYVLIAALGAAAADAARQRFNRPPSARSRFVAGYFLLWVAAVFSVGAQLYPHSETLGAYHDLQSLGFGRPWLPLVLASLVLISLIPLAAKVLATVWGRRRAAVSTSLVVAVAATLLVWERPALTSSAATESQPNLIILGIDSLRPDYMGHRSTASATPFLDTLLADSVLFDDGITPLARTNPSWTSLLTGYYPINNGAVINLTAAQSIHTQTSIAHTLRNRGYHTIFATDEVRFSNIDGHYGFSQIIGPRMGAGDFLLGVLGDIPLVNLLINTQLGRWLLPYQHANRAVAYGYHPETFDRLLFSHLRSLEGPAMIAIHLTLPHWPYHWAEPKAEVGAEENGREVQFRRALERTDKQAEAIMSHLQQGGWLDNAIIVVLSDHGESFGNPEDNIFRKHVQGDGVIASGPVTAPPAGHGSSLEAPDQYQIIAAIQRFDNGVPAYHAGPRQGRITLMDLRPTLSQLLDLDEASLDEMDGLSLASIIHATPGAESVPDRYLFMETGFNTPAVMADAIRVDEVFEETHNYYQVDPETGRLFIAPANVGDILVHKQFAVMKGDWKLIATPSNAGRYHFRLVHMPTGRWSAYGEHDHLHAPGHVSTMKERLLDRIDDSWRAYREIYANPDLRSDGAT